MNVRNDRPQESKWPARWRSWGDISGIILIGQLIGRGFDLLADWMLP